MGDGGFSKWIRWILRGDGGYLGGFLVGGGLFMGGCGGFYGGG